MFDVTSFETIVGATLALVSLVLLFVLNGYRNEKGDAEYLRNRLTDAAEYLSAEERAHVEADELMMEASALITALIGALGEADEDLDAVDEALDAAEEEVEDLEAEVDEAMESWREAVAFSRLAVSLLEIFKPLAFGERD